MPRTVVHPRFRGLLGTLIKASGMPQAEIARRAFISAPYISQILSNDRTPSLEVARSLDEVLNARGQLAALVALIGRDDDLDQLALAANHPRSISATAITALSRVLHDQRYLDDTMGSAALIDPVRTQLDQVTTMVVEATGPTRPDVLYVSSQWAEFLGWLYLSTGQYADAETWLARALQWATMHGDRDLIATVLSYQGHAAWLGVKWRTSIDLAKAALRDEQVYPGQRAYDAYAAARAHATLGEIDDAELMLELGNRLAEDAEGWDGPIPPWQYYRAGWFWQLERGLVALRIARWQPWSAETAAAQLRDGLNGMPEEFRSSDWAAEYMTHLASAYLRADELEAAKPVLDRAGEIAEATRSLRVAELVKGQRRRVKYLERRDVA